MNALKRQMGLRVAGIIVIASAILFGITGSAAAAAPTITSFTPTSGPVGTQVTITGTNFVDVTGVTFKNVGAAFTVTSSTTVTATVPAGAMTGRISVATLGGTATSSTNFTVTIAGAPTITSFTPGSGPVGTLVTITGTNFSCAPPASPCDVTDVKFKNTSATFTINSSTSITATVPSGATTGSISLTNPNGTATSSTNFTVTAAGAPTITSFTPTSGLVGTSVTITGTNFIGVTGVKFNGKAAPFAVNSVTQITATVPTGATTGPISVTNASGTGTSSTDFTVIGVPTITSFSPTSGPVGTIVTIRGTNFVGVTAVKFNNVAASTFSVTSPTQIMASVPSGATTGRISVTNPSGTGTSRTNFTVTGGTTPTISSFSPTSGKVGTVVTITGTNLTGATGVKFGSASATFTVNSATQITTTVPAGATTGSISVTTPSGTGTSSTSFAVIHRRSVSLRLSGHLAALGSVSVSDGFANCRRSVIVKIQRLISGAWQAVAKTRTANDGSYRIGLPDKNGKYRARAPRVTLPSGNICGQATSGTKANG